MSAVSRERSAGWGPPTASTVQRPRWALLAERLLPREWPATLALGIYAVLVFALLPRHEPWFDEAQAWLLARDSNPWALLTHDIHYEGSPALWHLLLMLPAHLHLPYLALSVMGAILAVAAAYLLLRFAPFPLALRVVLPFTYFLFYQYAVISRSYNLLPPLLFGLAVVWPLRRQRPLLFGVLLALIANVSSHGTLIAAGLLVAHVADVPRAEWRQLLRGRELAGIALVVLAGAVAAYQLRIPPDQSFTSPGLHLGRQHLESVASTMLNGSLTGHDLLSFGALGLSLPLLYRGRALLAYALPTLGVLGLSAVKYFNVWHEGILFLIWVFALWIALQRLRSVEFDRTIAYAALLGLVAVSIVQLMWSGRAYIYDWRHTYSGAARAAEYIKSHHLDRGRIYAEGFVNSPFADFALQPYFDRNIYSNYHHQGAFYVWTRRPLLDRNPNHILTDKPDVVVWAIKFGRGDHVPDLPGYRRIDFRGYIYWENGPYQQDSYALLVRE